MLAVPVVAATVAVAVFSVLEAGGRTPLSDGPPRNIAEAAGMGRGSEVLRLLRAGHDPNRVERIRPEIISSVVTQVTAMEAAVWSRRVQLVRLLDEHGAVVGTAERRHLACLARDLGAPDIVDYLKGNEFSCADQQTLEQVLERSREARDNEAD